jgi:hypothetical protein
MLTILAEGKLLLVRRLLARSQLWHIKWFLLPDTKKLSPSRARPRSHRDRIFSIIAFPTHPPPHLTLSLVSLPTLIRHRLQIDQDSLSPHARLSKHDLTKASRIEKVLLGVDDACAGVIRVSVAGLLLVVLENPFDFNTFEDGTGRFSRCHISLGRVD